MLYFLVVMDFVVLAWVAVPTQVFGMHGKHYINSSSPAIVYFIYETYTCRVLLALIILMCICGWAGCGARRYYAVRRGSSYRQMVSYDSYSNESKQIYLWYCYICQHKTDNLIIYV